MRRLWCAWFLVIVLTGCGTGRGYVVDTIDEVQAATGVKAAVVWTKQFEGWENSSAGNRVFLHPGWTWEPSLYFRGALVYWFLRADHLEVGSPQWESRVASACSRLGIPLWAVPPDELDTKRSATVQQARLEGAMIDHPSNSAPGWPTFYYKRGGNAVRTLP